MRMKVNHSGSRSRLSDAILSRLRVGPAKNAELASLGGLNYRARVSDLRADGWAIEVDDRGWYRLAGPGQMKLI